MFGARVTGPTPLSFNNKNIFMKTIKIYGVYGMMEWDSTIQCNNGVTLNLHFKGGSESSLGTIPAKCTVDNPVTQALVESSDFFKKGKIKLVKVIRPKVEAAPAKTNNTPKPVSAPKPQAAPAAEVVEEASDLKKVSVSDLADARDYLAREFNVPSTKIRNLVQIKAAARENGIVFEGL